MIKKTLMGEVCLSDLDFALANPPYTNFDHLDFALSQNMATDFDLLDKLLMPTTSRPKTPKRSKRKRNQPKWNATQEWFFKSSCNNYERVMQYCVTKAHKDETCGELPLEDYQDLYQDWVLDICRKDNLAEFINKGKEVKMSVLYWWYRQLVHRASMASAQDPLNRMKGARTQNEIAKNLTPMHDMDKMGKAGMEIAEAHVKTDSETGQQVGETDYYYSGKSPDQELEDSNLIDHVKEVILDHYGEVGEDRVQLFFQMMDDDKGGFKSKTEWAEYWNIPRSTLNKRIESIQKTVQAHLA